MNRAKCFRTLFQLMIEFDPSKSVVLELGTSIFSLSRAVTNEIVCSNLTYKTPIHPHIDPLINVNRGWIGCLHL